MKAELLRYLVCPQCQTHFNLKGVDHRHSGWQWRTQDGKLECKNGHTYSINSGVPVIMNTTDEKQVETAGAFSRKWEGVPDYGYEEKTRDFHRKWYIEKYGWGDEEVLGDVLFNSKMILDAGCGIGRDVLWYSGHSMSPIIGVDISDSAFIANAKLDAISNVHIVKADIMNLPFKRQQFDFIVSDFVLHHTPDTRKALCKLVDYLAPGGYISFYIYALKDETREFADDMIRSYTTKMSHEDCMKFSKAVTEFGKAVSEINLELQRDIYWKLFKCFWNNDFSVDHNVSVNYDWYSPAYAWRHAPWQVLSWCNQLGLERVSIDIQQSGISFRGRKPCVG